MSETYLLGEEALSIRVRFGYSDMLEPWHELAVDDNVAEESVERLDAHGYSLPSVEAGVHHEQIVSEMIPRDAEYEVALAFVVPIDAVLQSTGTEAVVVAHRSDSSLRYQR